METTLDVVRKILENLMAIMAAAHQHANSLLLKAFNAGDSVSLLLSESDCFFRYVETFSETLCKIKAPELDPSFKHAPVCPVSKVSPLSDFCPIPTQLSPLLGPKRSKNSTNERLLSTASPHHRLSAPNG